MIFEILCPTMPEILSIFGGTMSVKTIITKPYPSFLYLC